MTKWLALLCACLALGFVAAGCGGDDDDEGGGGAQTQEQPAETGGRGGATAPETVKVAMKNTEFDPESVTVPKGGAVEWLNEDSVGHDVTKVGGAGPDFKSGEPGGLGEGDNFKQTFDTAGEVKYECTVHPGMEGTVTVK